MEKLSSKLAQNIVDRTMEILSREINIRDRNGFVIASGDKERLHTIYKYATKPIKEGQTVKLTEGEAKKIPGAKPGIDLPIYYRDKIMGSVSIIGDPSEIETYAGLVQMTVELMIKQAFNIEKMQLEEQAEEHFINELLNNDNDYTKKIMQNKAKVMGFDIDGKYSLIVLDVINFWDIALEQSNNKAVKWQKYNRKIKFSIEKIFKNTRVAYLKEEKFVIVNNIKQNNIKDLTRMCERLIDFLYKNYNFICKIGIGCAHKGIYGIKVSFQEGLEALQIGQKLCKDKKIYNCNKLQLEKIIKNIKSEYRNKISEIFPLEKHYQESIETYFATNLNISETARKLYLHRNTVIYRLKKIHKMTGLNPRLFNEAVCLKLALLSYKYKVNKV